MTICDVARHLFSQSESKPDNAGSKFSAFAKMADAVAISTVFERFSY